MFSRWARVIGHMAAVRDATVFDYGSGHAHMSTAAETFRRLCEGLPIYVAQTAHAGRGVFARDDIPAGTRIHMAIPVVQHPTHAHIHEACYRCLAPLPLAARSASMKAKASLAAAKGGRVSMHEYAAFCEPGPGAGRSCRELAQEEFLASESSLDLSEFEHFCSGMGAEEDVAPAGQKAAKYPLLVARLANLCAQGASAPDALSHLNFVNLPHPPPEEFEDGFKRLSSAVDRRPALPDTRSTAPKPSTKGDGGDPFAFLNLPWYTSVMARLHINAFRIDLPSVPPLPAAASGGSSLLSWEHLAAAAAAAVVGDGGVGTGAFLLLSMYNHSCAPNVEPQWTKDATATVVAKRDVEKGEELYVSYIDADMPTSQRQRTLQWAYGFTCQCCRCKEGLERTSELLQEDS
eukprot:jgi/Mesvir1/19369/Mv10416-RA.1